MLIATSIYILICYLFIEIRYNLYTIFVLFIIEKEKIKTDCCYFFMVVLSQIKTCYFYTFSHVCGRCLLHYNYSSYIIMAMFIIIMRRYLIKMLYMYVINHTMVQIILTNRPLINVMLQPKPRLYIETYSDLTLI